MQDIYQAPEGYRTDDQPNSTQELQESPTLQVWVPSPLRKPRVSQQEIQAEPRQQEQMHP